MRAMIVVSWEGMKVGGSRGLKKIVPIRHTDVSTDHTISSSNIGAIR